MERKLLVLRILFALAVLFVTAAPAHVTAASEPAGERMQVIEMTAKKYEYDPSMIRVKKGTKVQLKIKALDHTHGFKISLIPEGTKTKGPAGLVLSTPQDNWKIEKGQVQVIEFVAVQPGTYDFRCSHFCGFGHSHMKGQIVVEP